MLQLANREKTIALVAGLIPTLWTAIMGVLANFGATFAPWVWVTYGLVCGILLLVCVGLSLHLFWSHFIEKGWARRYVVILEAVAVGGLTLGLLALYEWGVVWPKPASEALQQLQAENDTGHAHIQGRLEEAAKIKSAPDQPSRPRRPAQSPMAGTLNLPAKQTQPPHLTRSFTLTGFEPNLATPPSGERQLDSYSISFANMGGDMIRSTVKSFSLSADGSIVLTAGERTLNFLAPGQTQSAGISPTSGQRIPLATGTKEMIAEIRIDYDTVPPSGVRHVYRKVRHIVHWPEEGRSLWLETSILDEGEN